MIRTPLNPLTRLALTLGAVAFSFIVAGLFVLLNGANPLDAYRELLSAGFGCRILHSDPHPLRACAALTTLQMMTPLLLSGLSAVIAFRTGLFSLGQAGQMILGAAAASAVGSALSAPRPLLLALTLAGGALAGAAWALIPGALRAWLGVSEVLTTLIFNALAGMTAGHIAGWGPLPEAARLTRLAFNTKLSAGWFIALLAAAAVYAYLWRSGPGYAQRMAGDAPGFAQAGGIPPRGALMRAMLISGALAGLAGTIEVMGVHYRFVSVFSGGDGFDGVAVAVLGQAHPLGAIAAAFALAGLRLGATNGLQMHLSVPRELGNMIIAMMLVLVSIRQRHQSAHAEQ